MSQARIGGGQRHWHRAHGCAPVFRRGAEKSGLLSASGLDSFFFLTIVSNAFGNRIRFRRSSTCRVEARKGEDGW